MVQALIERLQDLEQIYREFDVVSDDLSCQLGVPLCIPNCGKCCEVVLAHRIEAVFAVHVSIREGILDEVASRAQNWLLEHHSQAPTYDGPPLDSVDTKISEEFRALAELKCPFLLADRTCLIYHGRPMVCRAYGVTRIAGPTLDFCPRPLGKGETELHKAWANTPELKDNINKFIASLNGTDWKMVGRLPTAIFDLVHPERFKEYATDNRIASAKLIGLPRLYPGLLWQEQIRGMMEHAKGIDK